MSDFLKDVWRFIWNRDSDSAMCLCIGMAHYMTTKGLIDMADYFKAVHENVIAHEECPSHPSGRGHQFSEHDAARGEHGCIWCGKPKSP